MEKILKITNRIDEIAKLAPFIDELSEQLNLSSEVSFNLNLVVEEAITNVIMYAYPNDNDKPIELMVSTTDDGLRLMLRLTDKGIPFDPTKEAPEADVTSDVEDRPIGGLGIFLIKQMMDNVNYKYENGCNILIMTKNIQS